MKLTDTQLIVLTKASQLSTMLALPLPPNLKGGAANKVVIPLIQKGLLEEIAADTRTGETTWRETRAGQGVTLAITEARLAAIGIGPELDADRHGMWWKFRAPEGSLADADLQAPKPRTFDRGAGVKIEVFVPFRRSFRSVRAMFASDPDAVPVLAKSQLLPPKPPPFGYGY